MVRPIRGQRDYKDLLDVPVPVGEENFRLYGASAAPTLVLVDRQDDGCRTARGTGPVPLTSESFRFGPTN
jgi:hypothetical protein